MMVSKNFSREELRCGGIDHPCPHCFGDMKCPQWAIDALQRVRETLGVPLIINSAYRCPAHNTAVGGAKSSRHLDGTAFDVALSKDVKRSVLVAAAKLVGFKGIGHYDSFVHIDLRPVPAFWDFRTKPKPKKGAS